MTASSKSRRRLFWLGLIGLLAALYGGYRWAITPHVNPNPTKKVVVRGVLPYDRGFEPHASISFYTYNPSCKKAERIFFIFPAANVSREHRVDIVITREPDNRYSLSYYKDHILPGWCEWTYGGGSIDLLINGTLKGQGSLSDAIGHNQFNYECRFHDSLIPGRGKDVREKSIVCSDSAGRNHNFDPNRTDIEVNFFWDPRIRYEYIGPAGRIESTWKEGEEK